MNWFTGSFLIGLILNIESLRRGFLGGTQLSLFIIKDYGLDWLGRDHIEMLKTYLTIEQAMIDTIPDDLQFFIWPFMDHHDAGETYVSVLEDLVELQDPANCSYYWNVHDGGGVPV